MKKYFIISILISVLLVINVHAYNPNPDFVNVPDKYLTNEGLVALSTEFDEQINQKVPRMKLRKSSLNTSAEIEVADSMIVVDWTGKITGKTYYEYNNKGERILVLSYTWQSAENKLVYSSKNEFVYGRNSENDDTILQTSYTWDIQKNEWVYRYRYDMVFQGQTNYYKILITDNWDAGLGSWKHETKLEQYYDDDLNDYTIANYTWDEVNIKWFGVNKTGYVYNGDNLKSTSIYQWNEQMGFWDFKTIEEYADSDYLIAESTYKKENSTSTWIGENKDLFEKNANKGTTIKTHYKWDSNSNDWISDTKVESSYDHMERELYFQGYSWDNINKRWIGVRYEIRSYDPAGNLTEETRYGWIENENKWYKTYSLVSNWAVDGIGNWKILYTIELLFNISGLETSRLQMYRSSIEENWDANLTYKKETIYNDNNLSIQEVRYNWNFTNNNWNYFRKTVTTRKDNGKIAGSVSYQWNSNNWVEISRSTTYYSTIVLGNNAPELSAQLHLYPNPVNEILTIQGTMTGQIIRLYNINGQLLANFSANANETNINVTNINENVFVVELNGKTVQVIKANH